MDRLKGLKRMVGVFLALSLLGYWGMMVPGQTTRSAPLFLFKWGEFGGGLGQFSGPEAIEVGPDGKIYVADTYNHRVQVFDAEGTFLFGWGSLCDLETKQGCLDPDGSGPLQSGDGQFKTPEGIAIDPLLERVYVADSENHRIQAFSIQGEFLSRWGNFGSTAGHFYLPVGLAIDDVGFVYVADVLNHRIQVFDAGGTFLRQWGVKGSGPGEFQFPADVAARGTRLYVVDNGNHRIQQFDLRGNFVSEWGGMCDIIRGEGCVDPDGPGNLEAGDGQFRLPFSIAVDDGGLVYVVDQGNGRAMVLSPDGQFVAKWGSLCAVVEGVDAIDRVDCRDPDLGGPLQLGDGQFYSPKGIALGADGRIYVADSDNHRVQVFR